MPFLSPPWRSFCSLTTTNEVASASACCSFSFVTLEVASGRADMAVFALTEQRQIHAWRWAICSTQGLILHAGSEPTQVGAKRVAENALRLEVA